MRYVDHTTPLWLHGGERPPTDRFKLSERCNCIGKQEYYFSDDLSYQAIAKKLCATCPMFKPCTRWTLANFDLLPDGIFAGMTFDERRRKAHGEPWWDWRRDFDYAARMARAEKRKRLAEGRSKRVQRLAEMPICLGCGSNQYVVREGRNKFQNRQQYQCTACGPTFLGEEL